MFVLFNFTPLSSRGLGHLVFIQKIAGSNPASGTNFVTLKIGSMSASK